MDTWTDDFAPSDVDTEMTVLTPDDITYENPEASDDVENLRNSLREAVHDENVQPKMQCLMMDSSFSMVTMQGEDSGIAWETTPSRCNTPWASEAGSLSVDFCSPVAVRPTTPGSQPAGKIIFFMDEELMSRRKKTKERGGGRRSRAERQVLTESFDNISGRPELIEFSQPNVKTEEEDDEEEPIDPLEDKEQRLFRLVSEGSEILNIIVPPKLVSVDEEESKEMEDNLSYLEASHVPKASEEIHDSMLDLNFEMVVSPNTPAESGAARDDEQPSLAMGPYVMDPPGAPLARPPDRRAAGNVDYFEPFTLIGAQAPGSPAVVAHGQEEVEEEDTTESQEIEQPEQAGDHPTTTDLTMDKEKSDTISLGEITSELLDEVFYGGTDNDDMKLDKEDGGGLAEGVPARLPSKPSGSSLFGSQEDILTPVFLPEGPPKIINPTLLEEPKAMAFLYTDLYEDALGSWYKDEDAESMTSEKSFHSRYSDQEARGYLEKYALIDETPVVEAEPTDVEKSQEDGPRILNNNLYDFGTFISKPEKGDIPDMEEEVTDFFRSSANSSPCDVEPFPRPLEEDETVPTSTTNTAKVKKRVSIMIEVEEEDQVPAVTEDLDWEDTYDYPGEALEEMEVNAPTEQELWQEEEELEVQKPIPPPRRKATSSPKASLDLTPLTPVDLITQEKEEACGKEQRVEEKEKASPAETADEGDGDGEEATPVDVSPSENDTSTEPPLTENVTATNEITVLDTKPSLAEEKDAKTVEEEERSKTEASSAAAKQTEPEKVVIKPSESAKAEVNPEKQSDSSTALPPKQDKGQCVIL